MGDFPCGESAGRLLYTYLRPEIIISHQHTEYAKYIRIRWRSPVMTRYRSSGMKVLCRQRRFSMCAAQEIHALRCRRQRHIQFTERTDDILCHRSLIGLKPGDMIRCLLINLDSLLQIRIPVRNEIAFSRLACRAVWRDRISFPLRSIRSACISSDPMRECSINVTERSEEREASAP